MNTSRQVKLLWDEVGARSCALRHGLVVLGLLGAMAVLMPVGLGGLVAGLPAAAPESEAIEAEQAPPSPESLKHRALARYLSKRYQVALDAAEPLVGVAFSAGHQVGLDPLLILAVMAVESRLNPFAQSEYGAKGLMQIIPGFHRDKVPEGHELSILDPMTNVLVGSRILKEYIRRTGSLESGLQFYNGALWDTSSQYAQKVMAVQQRLRQAANSGERPATASRPSA